MAHGHGPTVPVPVPLLAADRLGADTSGQGTRRPLPAGPPATIGNAALAALGGIDSVEADTRLADVTHDGTTAVVFRIAFTEEPHGFSYKTLRDHTLNIRQGQSMDATSVRRLEAGKNKRWEVTINPVSNEDMTVSLGPTTDCDDTGSGTVRQLIRRAMRTPEACRWAKAGKILRSRQRRESSAALRKPSQTQLVRAPTVNETILFPRSQSE